MTCSTNYLYFVFNPQHHKMDLTETAPKQIVFYDGECGFCNRTVGFVLKHEKSSEIYFTALQSEFSKQFFEAKNIHLIDFETFYFFNDGVLHERSTAGLELSRYLRFPYSLGIYLKWIPKKWRDAVYNRIAKNRKKLAGDYCFLPDSVHRKRFLA